MSEASPKGAGVTALELSFQSTANSRRLPQLSVAIEMGDWKVTTVIPPDTVKQVPLPHPGAGTIRVVSNSWVESEVAFACDSGETTAILLVVSPKALVSGRVVEQGTGDPVVEFTVWIETKLHPSGLGRGVSSGVPLRFRDAGGEFAAIPYQAGTAFRAHIAATGFEDYYGGWVAPSPSGLLEIGTARLKSTQTHPLHFRVWDSDGGRFLGELSVSLSRTEISVESLALKGGRLAARFGGEMLFLSVEPTGGEGGSYHVDVPDTHFGYLVVCAPGYPSVSLDLSRALISGGVQEIRLSAGAGLLLTAILSEADRKGMRNVSVEVRPSDGLWIQRDLDEDMVEAQVPLDLQGLDSGMATLLLLGESGQGFDRSRVLIASASVLLNSGETAYLVLDCVPGKDGGILGDVIAPSGLNDLSLRAALFSEESSVLLAASSAVDEAGFELRKPAEGGGLVVVSGSSRAGDVCALWFGDGSLGQGGKRLLADLSGSLLVGHMGPLDPGQFEAIVVRPLGEHAGWQSAFARVYPSPNGDFRVWGLPPGRYSAIAQGRADKGRVHGWRDIIRGSVLGMSDRD